MSDVVETIYGKYNKYEIVKETGTFSSTKFYILRDGKSWKSSFSSLADAVQCARDEG